MTKETPFSYGMGAKKERNGEGKKRLGERKRIEPNSHPVTKMQITEMNEDHAYQKFGDAETINMPPKCA